MCIKVRHLRSRPFNRPAGTLDRLVSVIGHICANYPAAVRDSGQGRCTPSFLSDALLQSRLAVQVLEHLAVEGVHQLAVGVGGVGGERIAQGIRQVVQEYAGEFLRRRTSAW